MCSADSDHNGSVSEPHDSISQDNDKHLTPTTPVGGTTNTIIGMKSEYKMLLLLLLAFLALCSLYGQGVCIMSIRKL